MNTNPDTGSGNRPGSPAPEARPRTGPSLIVILLIVLAVFLLFRAFTPPGSGEHRVSYAQFVEAAEQHKFTSVVIGDGWVRGFVAAPQSTQPVPAEPKAAPSPEEAKPWYATAVPGTEADLARTLQNEGIDYSAAPKSGGLGSMLLSWVVPLAIVFLFWGWLFRRMGSRMGQGPGGVLSFGKMKTRTPLETHTDVGFADVAGVDEAVDELEEIVEFLRTPGKFRRLGGRIPKGVLLVGPPGTGKTLLARAVAGEANVPFFSLTGSQFVEMFVGVGAARVRDLFAQAEAKAPCIVFIDELDAIGKTRSGGMLAHEEREQTLDQLLAEMDGFDPRVGLIVLAATNRPEVLDAALLRPGRFDRQVLVDRPDKDGREKILAIHARGVKLDPDVDLRDVAAETPGFVGADLANIVNEAALLAARRGKDSVTRAEFDEAVERGVAGLEKKNRRLDTRERKVVAHHESGHAAVGWMLPRAERVRKVSIVPRGLAALGYTLQRPFEDRYLMSEPELRQKIATLLGGRASEELFFGEVSTGSSNDLKEATELARAMVQEFGMSETLGPVSLGGQRRSFLPEPGGGIQPVETGGISQKTHEAVDAEVQRIVEHALQVARGIVREQQEHIREIARRLLAQEVVEEEELATILGPKAGVHDESEPGDVYAPAPPMSTSTPPS